VSELWQDSIATLFQALCSAGSPLLHLLTLPAYYAEQSLCGGRVSVLVSVRLSVPLIDSSSGGWRAAGGFAAERPVIDSFGRAAGVVLQAPALSSKCG